jgi:hypothetical protein
LLILKRMRTPMAETDEQGLWARYVRPGWRRAGAVLAPFAEIGEKVVDAANLGLPTPAERGLNWALQNTGPGKRLTELMAENPEVMADIEAGGNILGATPYIRGVPKAVNAVSANVPTLIPNFYSPNPRESAAGVAGVVRDAVIPAVTQGFSPQAAANFREKGVGLERVRELQDLKSADASAQMAASGFMAQQRGQRNTMATDMPSYQANVRSQFKASEGGAISQALRSDYPDLVSDEVATDIYNRISRDLSANRSLMDKGAEAVNRTFKWNRGPKNTDVIIRDKAAPEVNLGGEVQGVKGQTIRGISFLRGDVMNDWAKRSGLSPDGLTGEQLKDFLVTIGPFERGGWLRGIKDLGYRTPSAAAKAYLVASKKAPDTRTPKQQELVDVVDGIRADSPPNVFVGEDGLVRYSASYASASKDLGNMGIKATIDPKTSTIYSAGYDGHDLFGMDPLGGTSLWNVTPIQVTQYGSRKAPTDSGAKTAAVAAREAEGVRRVEARTGIKRNKGEGLLAYQKRVLKDWNAPVTARDYLNVTENVGMLGSMLLGTVDPSEEQ